MVLKISLQPENMKNRSNILRRYGVLFIVSLEGFVAWSDAFPQLLCRLIPGNSVLPMVFFSLTAIRTGVSVTIE